LPQIQPVQKSTTEAKIPGLLVVGRVGPFGSFCDEANSLGLSSTRVEETSSKEPYISPETERPRNFDAPRWTRPSLWSSFLWTQSQFL
jgi:hypothetical protein